MLQETTFILEHAAHSPTNKTVRHCRNCYFASQNMGSNNFSCLVCGTCVTQKWEDFLGLCIWVQTLMSLHECMLLYTGTVRPPCLPVRVADVHSTSEYGPNLLFTTFEPSIVWLNTLTLQWLGLTVWWSQYSCFEPGHTIHIMQVKKLITFTLKSGLKEAERVWETWYQAGVSAAEIGPKSFIIPFPWLSWPQNIWQLALVTKTE